MNKIKNILMLLPMLFVGGALVYAAAPVGGYAPNATLDPDCAPGDTDCLVTASADTNAWQEVGTGNLAGTSTAIYHNAGNVGIGTETPFFKLHVEQDGGPGAIFVYNKDDAPSSYSGLIVNSGSTDQVGLTLGAYQGAYALSNYAGRGVLGVASSRGMLLQARAGGVHLSALANGGEQVTLMPSGRFGIGTTAPTAQLHVQGDGTTAQPLAIVDTNSAVTGLKTIASFRRSTTSSGTQGLIVSQEAAAPWTTRLHSAGSLAYGPLELGGGVNSAMHISTSGRVGIGTTAPGSKLSVVGLPSGTTDAVTGGSLAGAVCITDAGNMYIDTDGTCAN